MDNRNIVNIILLFTVTQNSVAQDTVDIHVQEQDEVTLKCPLEGDYAYPTWKGPVALETPLMDGIKFNEPSILWADDKKRDILIEAADLNHGGSYTCEDSTGRVGRVNLYVEYFKNFEIFLSPKISTEENNRIELYCAVHSNPDAIIDLEVQSEQKVENIPPTECRPDTNGEYRTRCIRFVTFYASKRDNGLAQSCRFSYQNETTSEIRSAKINFEFQPTSIKIHGNKPIRSEEFIDLTCSTDSSNPVSTITWLMGTNKTAHANDVLDRNHNPTVTDAEFNGKSITDAITVGVNNMLNGQFVFCCARDLCDNITLDVNITSNGDMVVAWMTALAACIVVTAGSNYL